ncbi:MAG: hypothetical protein M0R21_08925 [Lentimicrobiaceae bacterium]|nr:hypothetical protein [Lentimicrobiaceae bacterium]
MLSRSKLIFVLIALFLVFSMCCPCKKGSVTKAGNVTGVAALPHTIIYKTKGEYSILVPVILSEDKKEIVSFPGVNDVYYQGKLALPTLLSNSFWLDNRGINENVAFISLTYLQYSQLKITPTGKELYRLIIDKNPLLQMYDCGLKTKITIEQINNAIEKGDFSAFKRLK